MVYSFLNKLTDVTHHYARHVDLFCCVALATHDLIGFSHPKARYFLLLRQKQVSKEKATRLPLASCALPFLLGVAKRDFLIPLATRSIPAAPV
jgi:hypothetical protein